MYGSNAKNATCTAYWSHVACRQRASVVCVHAEIHRPANTNGSRRQGLYCAVVWNSLSTDLRVSSVPAATFAKHVKTYVQIPLGGPDQTTSETRVCEY